MNSTIRTYIYSIPEKYKRERVFEYLNHLEELIQDSEKITPEEKELLGKCYIVSSFMGIDNMSHINYSLGGLKFLYEHKNELKENLSMEDIYFICCSYDLYVILNGEPKHLKDIRELYMSYKNIKLKDGVGLKDIVKANTREELESLCVASATKGLTLKDLK